MNNKKYIVVAVLTALTLSLVGCGNKNSPTEEIVVEISAPMDSLMGEFEASLLAGMSADTKLMDEEYLTENYGITPDMYEEIEARLTIDDRWCDEYFFVQASEGNIDHIVDLVKERVKYLVSNASDVSDEFKAQIADYKLYVRGDYAVFSFGLSANHAVEFFKEKFIE